MTGPATTILTPATGDDSWRERAACLDVPGDVFFPVRGNSRKDDPTYDAQIAEAKAICGNCPVRVDCLDWALATGQRFGIWGGLTAEQRAAVTERRDKVRDLWEAGASIRMIAIAVGITQKMAREDIVWLRATGRKAAA